MVGASEAGPVGVDGVRMGARAGPATEAGGGLMEDAAGGEDGERVWEEWDSGDWVKGTGIDSRAGAEEEAAAAEVVAGAEPEAAEGEGVPSAGMGWRQLQLRLWLVLRQRQPRARVCLVLESRQLQLRLWLGMRQR